MGSSMYCNSSDLGWVVQKFGGTSVGKFPVKVRLTHSARPRDACINAAQIARDIVK